jgi:hypothetical protein
MQTPHLQERERGGISSEQGRRRENSIWGYSVPYIEEDGVTAKAAIVLAA